MGWFGSLLMGVASGFMAFFASTFCAIVFILIYNSATHRSIDFALSYRRVGFPVGVVVMVVALCYLGTLWCKRILRRS
jgi:ABC-type dipeptide/oligopeptide/nickel transport system permease subunit